MRSPSLPNRTGGSPASGFPVSSPDGLAQALVPRPSGGTHQPRHPRGFAHPIAGGPLLAVGWRSSGFSPPRRAQPCGTTSGLASCPPPSSHHYLPASLRSAFITRFLATTDALTPTGPFLVPGRGSLIHVHQTSGHSVSNHLWLSARRCPLPPRWQPILFGLRLALAGSPEPPAESSSLWASPGDPVLRTGRSLPVALHPGLSPRCSYFQLLALKCWPGQGLAPCCSMPLSGALEPGFQPGGKTSGDSGTVELPCDGPLFVRWFRVAGCHPLRQASRQ